MAEWSRVWSLTARVQIQAGACETVFVFLFVCCCFLFVLFCFGFHLLETGLSPFSLNMAENDDNRDSYLVTKQQ